jgi:DNA-binding NtrC family response regulator
MAQLFDRLRKAAAEDWPLLVEGEPGSGKKALGRLVHTQSRRAESPLVIVGCGSVAVELVDAELFGDPSRGNADSERPGALKRASSGTLLLHEVAQLPMGTQARLAASLHQEEGHAEKARVRVIATSERPVLHEVHRGRFHQQLYEQLAAGTVTVPPLRARPEDIALLANHFIELAHSQTGSSPPPILPAAALEALTAHDWPGNARELRNVIERAVQRAKATGLPLEPVHLPLLGPATTPAADGFDPALSYRETRARFESQFERSYVTWLLERHRGNISAASREARMDRKYLYDLARRHGLRSGRERH